MNNICLLGRLTHDVELRKTSNGVSVASFTLAVDRGYVVQGGERQSDFINCVAWRHTADFVSKYFFKGQRLSLVGFLQSRKYKDKEGNNRTAYEVVAEHVYFADGKKQTATPSIDFEEVANDEQIPF